MANASYVTEQDCSKNREMLGFPESILIFSGKRKSGKDFITDELFKRYLLISIGIFHALLGILRFILDGIHDVSSITVLETVTTIFTTSPLSMRNLIFLFHKNFAKFFKICQD